MIFSDSEIDDLELRSTERQNTYRNYERHWLPREIHLIAISYSTRCVDARYRWREVNGTYHLPCSLRTNGLRNGSQMLCRRKRDTKRSSRRTLWMKEKEGEMSAQLVTIKTGAQRT